MPRACRLLIESPLWLPMPEFRRGELSTSQMNFPGNYVRPPLPWWERIEERGIHPHSFGHAQDRPPLSHQGRGDFPATSSWKYLEVVQGTWCNAFFIILGLESEGGLSRSPAL